MACACEEPIVYERKPPYVSQASLQRYLDGICANCNEVIAYGSEPSFPECCDDQIVTRGTSEVLRVDDASNTSYIGTGGPLSEYSFTTDATASLTANTDYTVPLSGATLTTITNNLALTVASNNLVVPRAGFYAIDVMFITSNNTAQRQTHYKVFINGASTVVQTYQTSGANPTEATNSRYGRVVHNEYLAANDTIGFRIHSGISINTIVSVMIRITRLSVSR